MASKESKMKIFFDAIRASVFGGNLTVPQVAGINAIFDAWSRFGDGDDRKFAVILATTKWETASTMQPIEEYGKGAGHGYGLPTGPWHNVYDGRGDVQLTFEANYIKATAELHKRGMFLDVDLDKNPELAMRQDIAAAIIVLGMMEGWFTGRNLADYINASGADYFGSRRVVNGTDHASDIATLAGKFAAALAADKDRGAPVPVAVQPAVPYPTRKVPPLPAPAQAAKPNLWLVLVNLLAGLLAALMPHKKVTP